MALEDNLYGLISTYLSAPQLVKSAVGRLYSAVPKRIRYGRLYRGFAAQASAHDALTVRELQRQKLRETLDHATKFVPAYAPYRRLFEEAEDIEAFLRQLPTTDKREIRRDPRTYITASESRKKAALPMHTGGNLGAPMQFFLEKGRSRPREAAYMEAMRSSVGDDGSGLTFSLRGRNVRGLGPSGGRWVMIDRTRSLVMGSTDHLKHEYMHLYAKELARWRPRRIEAFPSAIYPLARWLYQNPQSNAGSSVKFIYLFSENVYTHQRELLEAVFNCPVINHYGAAERILFAHSLPDDPWMHFWPQYGYLELLDRQGRPVSKPGQLGQIVGTSFDNFVMPFIRYCTEDYAVVADVQCQADSGFDVVERIEGRIQEFVLTRDDRLVSVRSLGAAHFKELGMVEEIQYLQERPGELVLRVVASTTIPQEANRQLSRAVERKLEDGCVVTVVQVPWIERTRAGKKIMVDQRVDLSAYLHPSAGDANSG